MNDMTGSSRLAILAAASLLLGCDPEKTIDSTKRAAPVVVSETKAAASAVADTGKSLVDAITKDGTLSKTARGWISEAAKGGGTIETIVDKGTQLGPQAVEIAKAVNAAIDSDTAIEPIYERTDAEGEAAVDKAIGEMPRVEVIDGLKIGFRQLDTKDTSASVSERGYLVVWRRNDRLIGFVYRTRSSIDIERLIGEAPKLIALVNAAAK